MGTLTWVLVGVGLLLAAELVLRVGNRVFRGINEDIPLERLFTWGLSDSVRHARDGSPTMMFHRTANILIQVNKTLAPDQPPPQIMRLRVLKKRASNPRWSRHGFPGRVLSFSKMIKGTFKLTVLPARCLPSPKTGEILLDIDCGGSRSKMEAAVETIVSEDPALAANPRFDLWIENGSTLCYGKFEEDMSQED